jgi:hypothetical protein
MMEGFLLFLLNRSKDTITLQCSLAISGLNLRKVLEIMKFSFGIFSREKRVIPRLPDKCSPLRNKGWLWDLAFVTDIMGHLNNLNKRL